MVPGHEDTSTAGLRGALTTKTSDLAVTINLVKLENGQFDLSLLVLNLLGGSVSLFFTLLGTSQKVNVEVQSSHIGDGREEGLRREILTSEREALGDSSNT